MQKFLTKILLISIILVGFGNISQTNAGELDELNSLFNIEEEFSCSSINSDIKYYPIYENKVDNLFRKLSTKRKNLRDKYRNKISKFTDKYLKILNKNKQKKLYTIVGYLKCKNEEKILPTGAALENLIKKKGRYNSTKDGIEIRKYFDGKATKYYFYLGNKLILTDFDLSGNKINYNIINRLYEKNPYLFISKTGGERDAKWKYDLSSENLINLEILKKDFSSNVSVWKENTYNKIEEYYIFNNRNKIIYSFTYDSHLDINFIDFNDGGNGSVLIQLIGYDKNDFILVENNYNNYHYLFIDSANKTEYKNGYTYIYGNNIVYKYYNGKIEEITKKGEFVKYIGGGVEARQNKLYTYFYYNGKLINTVKNKVNNDYELIYGNSMEFVDEDAYLSEYYAKRKLDLYSASLELDNDMLYFEKKIDGNKTKSFGYDLKTGKWNNYEWVY